MSIKDEFCTREGDKITLDDVLSLTVIIGFIGFLLFIERFLWADLKQYHQLPNGPSWTLALDTVMQLVRT